MLDVGATHGPDLRKKLPIYAFGAALGGQRVLDAAQALAAQSGIARKPPHAGQPHATYAHNDPNSAYPKNDFVARLVPFLEKIAKH